MDEQWVLKCIWRHWTWLIIYRIYLLNLFLRETSKYKAAILGINPIYQLAKYNQN